MSETESKTAIDPGTAAYYRAVAPTYGENWGDGPPGSYPANRKRWEIVRDRLQRLGVRSLLEPGCGEGSPLTVVRDELGITCAGFDAVPEMVTLAQAKFPDGAIWQGDIRKPNGWRAPSDGWALPDEYEAVAALGPFPHLTDREQDDALRWAHASLKVGGYVFVELRNELFSFFTLNAYSAALFGRLMPDGVPAAWRNAIWSFMAPPGTDPTVPPDGGRAGHYSSTYSRFNNPLTVPALFEQAGFRVTKIHPYHVHCAPPMFEHRDPELFHRLSLALEWPNPDYAKWPNLFRCSAFLVEAVRVE